MIDFHIRCDFYSDHYLEGEIVYCNIYFKDIEFALNIDKGTYMTFDEKGEVIEDIRAKAYNCLYSSIYDEEYSVH